MLMKTCCLFNRAIVCRHSFLFYTSIYQKQRFKLFQLGGLQIKKNKYKNVEITREKETNFLNVYKMKGIWVNVLCGCVFGIFRENLNDICLIVHAVKTIF